MSCADDGAGPRGTSASEGGIATTAGDMSTTTSGAPPPTSFDASGLGDTGGSGDSAGAPPDGGTDASDAETGEPPPPSAEVHMVGRFDESDPARPRSSWSGTVFRTRLSGTGISVSLGGVAGVHFQVEVDGQPTTTFVTLGGDVSYLLAEGLTPGEHDIVIVRRNEGYFGDVDFLGFEPSTGSSVVETPWPYTHRLELLGDSLTAGYGIEGTDGNCPFSAETESFYRSYGSVAGRNTNAAVVAVAYSGKGVFQNYGGDTNESYPELYPRTLTNDPASVWDFSRFVPEAVVVNLGTNDFSVAIADADYVDAYATLLRTVRANYPDAMIFCVSWEQWGVAAESLVLDAMDATGDANLSHLPFYIAPSEGFGCDFHTNVQTNARLGEELTQALEVELGW
jgi:hypothetical protein